MGDGLCCRFGAKQTDGAERVGRGLDEVGLMIFDKMACVNSRELEPPKK
jgi:hypothetical protein